MRKEYTRTIRLEVQYDGSQYSGWQRQDNKITIQEVLEKALTKISNEKATIFGSSRTDAGVHARKQVVSLSLLKSRAPLRAFVEGTNTLLPPDIRVMAAYEENVDFLAIKCAKSKIYRYYFRYTTIDDVFLKTVWQTRFKFDLVKMKKELKAIVGKHDFSCFQTHGKETRSSIRTIHRASIKKHQDDIYYLEIEGDGFLRHMVRSIMGTVMQFGIGKLKHTTMKEILNSKSRKKAGLTAPAHALFLWDVKLK